MLILPCVLCSLFLSNIASFTFNSLFIFPWLLCCSFPYSWVLFLFIPQLNPCSFPFLLLFSPTILSTADTQLIPTTYWPLSSNCVQVGSILLRSFSLFLMTNGLPISSKGQSVAEPPHISFPKMVKASIKSLCPRPLACIRWFPPSHFPFLVKILSQQSIFPKVVSVGYQIQVLSPFHQTTLFTPH